MKFASIATLASVASAATIARRAEPIDVQMEMTGNSAVKLTITNTGNDDLKIFKTGSILDKAPVEKVQVFQGDSKVGFEGVRLRVSVDNLDDEAFQSLAAGQNIEASFDAAELHDLTKGGDFDLVSDGFLSYATANTTEIAGIIPYTSNTIKAKVDGVQAREAHQAFKNKRTNVQSDCTGSKLTSTDQAISNCRSLATRAQSAASAGGSTFLTYFKSTSYSSTVAAVLGRVANECGSTRSGVSDTYCTDIYNSCSSGVLAYTLPSGSFIVNCPLYFSALPTLTGTCHAQDKSTTTLHETTHLSQIGGTQDLGYGYAAATALSGARAVNNADSYALFANAVYVGC